MMSSGKKSQVNEEGQVVESDKPFVRESNLFERVKTSKGPRLAKSRASGMQELEKERKVGSPKVTSKIQQAAMKGVRTSAFKDLK